MHRIQHALLNKNFSIGLTMLIEIYSRTHASLDNLNFCADSVVHPRIEMYSILEYLKSPSIFKDEDRNNIFKTFIGYDKNRC